MALSCRSGCGACCIAPGISSPLPGYPQGKPAGEPCPFLTADFLCKLWDSPDRPKVCRDLKPEAEMCGIDRNHALTYLANLEYLTRP